MKRLKSFFAPIVMMLLLWGGVVFIGCSGDDDISEPAPVESPDGDKTTGDESTGNKPTGGNTTGGETSDGDTTGGETTGGNTTGGETTGGETTGGETTVEVAPLYIEGITIEREQMTKVSDTEQIYKFTYSKTLAGWSSVAGSVEFKTMVDEKGWNQDWGGTNDKNIVLKVGNEEYTSLFNRVVDNLSNPKSIVVYDLIEGEEYTIRMQVDMATLSAKIRIEGRSVDVPGMQIVVSTGTGDSSNIPMTREGLTYTYEFIAAQTLSLSYYFKCPFLNTVYYGEGKELVKLDNTDDTLSKGNTLSIVKNYKYTIKIKAGDILFGDNGTFAGFDGKTSWNVEKGPPILWTGVLLWENTSDTVPFWNGSYTFIAKDTSVGFKLLRDDSDTMAWGGVSITPGKTMTLTYKTTLIPDENGFAYTVPEDKRSASDEVEYIKAESLTEGHIYTISIVGHDVALDKFEIYIEDEMKPVVFPENMGLQIWFNTGDNWSNNKYLKLTKEADHLYSCDVKAEGAVDDIRFDFVTGDTTPDWNDRWGIQTAGGEISLGERHGPFMNKEPTTRDKLIGTAGKTYHFEIDTSAGVWCTITESD